MITLPMNGSSHLSHLDKIPIRFEYSQVTHSEVEALQNGASARVLDDAPNILKVNSYYAQGLAGALPKMYARSAVCARVQKVAQQLEGSYGLLLFDAYRSLETQTALFVWMCEQIRAAKPGLSDDEVKAEARLFATDPTQRPHAVPPHNSGGAIDLALYDLSTGKMCYFGSEFDEASDRSRTDFFEAEFDVSLDLSEDKWLEARRHRRILFHLMKEAGFTNYVNEWWHFDLGDCMWASIHDVDWQYDRFVIAD